MKINNKKLTGVQHLQISAERYHLRRYIPDTPLITLVEQFWLVNWYLTDEIPHIQKNLPDPNFHLIFENQKLKLIGPISKTYNYKMEGVGQIIGIKFQLGALSNHLALPISNYVDKEVNLQKLINFDVDELIATLNGIKNDEQIIERLKTYMVPLVTTPSSDLIKVRELVNLIKNDTGIIKVEQLSVKSKLSIRTIQRYFKHHLGLSPKWLIRKYRLHQALDLLEQQEVNFLDIVEYLGYTDQSHLIRDFKEIIGVTPNNYLNR